MNFAIAVPRLPLVRCRPQRGTGTSARRWWQLGAALVVPALLGGAQAPARAEEPTEAARRVRFNVESAREVPNDWITAVVGFTAEDADPAKLAAQVNREMAWALERARAAPRVKAETGGYHTQPVYEEGRMRRWRAWQTLVLESADDEAMTALVGELQSRVQLQSFEFSVSPETQARVEEELIGQVLAAFTARAELVRKSLGASAYTLDEVSLNTGGPPPVIRMQMEMAKDAYAASAPAVEGGTSRITVNASASIVLE